MSRQIDKLIRGTLSMMNSHPEMKPEFSDEEIEGLIRKSSTEHCISDCCPYIFNAATGKFLYVSNKVEKILGFTRAEFVGNPLTEIFGRMIPYEQMALLNRLHQKSFNVFRNEFRGRNDVRLNDDLSVTRKDGVQRRILVSYCPGLWNELGDLVLTYGTISDITHLKHEGHPVVTITCRGDLLYKFEPDKADIVETRLVDLTKRELEIVQLISRGYDTEDIMSQLHLSRATVYAHRRNILAKTDSGSITKLVESLKEKGLIPR